LKSIHSHGSLRSPWASIFLRSAAGRRRIGNGRFSAKQITFIVGHAVFLEKGDQFFLERRLTMMLFLILNVSLTAPKFD